jgi:hypothetical protein
VLEPLVPEDGQGVTLRDPQPSALLELEGADGVEVLPLRQVRWSATFTASCNLALVHVQALLDLDSWGAEARDDYPYADPSVAASAMEVLIEGPRAGQEPAGYSEPREVPVHFVFQAQAHYLQGL